VYGGGPIMQTRITNNEGWQIEQLMKTVRKINLYKKYFKRLIDICFSLAAIIVLFPIFLITAVLVRIKLGSPIIYKQKRAGMNEKIFTLYKFRTMNNTRNEDGSLLPDSVRLTKFGRILRSTSLDELPELFNILKGDMSIIGPRPLLVQYLPYYTEIERLRHSIRPGLSGLAQINGRNFTTWEHRFAYDVEYVNNITFLGDVKIVLKTILVAFKRTGVGERGLDALFDFDKYRQRQLETGGKL
jgi:undecaprenyl phosphate N,N'-diacetylbacillosamine 1-phosphate transferase